MPVLAALLFSLAFAQDDVPLDLVIRVVGPEDLPISGADVKAENISHPANIAQQQRNPDTLNCVTGADGRCSIRLQPEPDLSLWATHDDYSAVTMTGMRLSADSVPPEIRLQLGYADPGCVLTIPVERKRKRRRQRRANQ